MGIFKKIGTAAFVAAVSALPVMATEGAGNVTLPETGVDISSYVTTAIVGLGGVIAVAVGGYFAFLLIKVGIRFAGRWLK